MSAEQVVISAGCSKKNIWSALFKAQCSIRAIEKASRNSMQNYDYTSGEDMIEHCGRALCDNGLALFTVGAFFVPAEMQVIADNQIVTMRDAYCTVDYILVHAESGESIDFKFELPIVPGKGRPSDKAYCSSLTTNLAYFLRNLLMVKRGDETAIDERDDSDYEIKPQSIRQTNDQQSRKNHNISRPQSNGTAEANESNMDTREAPHDTKAQRIQTLINNAKNNKDLDEVRPLIKGLPKVYQMALAEMGAKKRAELNGDVS